MVLSRLPAVCASLFVLIVWSPTVVAQTWTQPGAGPFSWPTSANWTPAAVPNAAGAIAGFTTTGGPATQTITLDAAITLGALDLTNTTTSYNFLAGAGGSFLFDNGVAAATITMARGRWPRQSRRT